MPLYLIGLEFRTPPFHVQFHYPNAQNSVPLLLDGAFLFFDKFGDDIDWRKKYLIENFEDIKNIPPEIRTSYLFPAIQKKNFTKIKIFSDHILTFEIMKMAKLHDISNETVISYPFNIRFNRRFPFDKILLLENSIKSIELLKRNNKIKGISFIDKGKGPFKSISITININESNLYWCFFADTNKIDKLKKYLEYLKITGIGKKRNMGWGDLKNYNIYEVDSTSYNTLSTDQIEFFQNKTNYLILIRPKEIKYIQDLIKNKYSPVKVKIGQGSIEPPYWQKKTIIQYAILKSK